MASNVVCLLRLMIAVPHFVVEALILQCQLSSLYGPHYVHSPKRNKYPCNKILKEYIYPTLSLDIKGVTDRWTQHHKNCFSSTAFN